MSSITLNKQIFEKYEERLSLREANLRHYNEHEPKVTSFVLHLLANIILATTIAHAITPILSAKVLCISAYSIVYLINYFIAFQNGKNEGKHEESQFSIQIFNQLKPKEVRT